MENLELRREKVALVVVDFQERLASAMPVHSLAQAQRNVAILLEAARRLCFPVIVTEQYPKGLGPTVPELAARIAELDPRPPVIEKLDFDACAVPSVADAIARTSATHVVVTGMEAHVCVYQTVRSLAARGLCVHVPIDAVTSRSDHNREIAAALYERMGAVVTCTETVVFDLLRRAEGDDFKALSKLVR